MRAARALLDIDQRELAQRSGLSLPTIQRMESSGGVVRGNVDSDRRRSRKPRWWPWRAAEAVMTRAVCREEPCAGAATRKGNS